MEGEAKNRLDFLDVARGAAALLVVAEHGLDVCCPGLLEHSVGKGRIGRIGVVLFLIISGFIIPTSLEQGGSNARFWLRRFFRLFPAYWLSIAMAFVYCLSRGAFHTTAIVDSPGDWLFNLTMTQGFFGYPHVWGVFWTLQLELVLYAACSLLFACGLLRYAVPVACGLFVLYIVSGLFRILFMDKPFFIFGERFFYFAPLVGLVARCYWTGRMGTPALCGIGLIHVAALLGLWGLNAARFDAGEGLSELTGTWLVAYAMFLSLLTLRRVPMPRVGCWLGRVSYSVYLLHPLVLVLLIPSQWPAWLFMPVLVGGTLLLAELSYRFVEAPGIALGRIAERRWFPKAGKHTAATPVPLAA